MADYDLALGIKPPQIDVATPLLTAAKIRASEQASQLHNVQTQQAQMELRRDQLGELVRSLDPYVGKPEFADKWRDIHDEGARRGIIPPQAMSMRDNPSVLAYQSLRAATMTPDQQFRQTESERAQRNFESTQALEREKMDKPIIVGPGAKAVKPSSGETVAANEDISDEDAKGIATRYVDTGNRMVMSGVGLRGTARNRVQHFIDEVMKEKGISTQDMGNREAEWEGRKAGQRVLGTQEAKMGSAAFEAEGAIKLARPVIDRVPRTSFLPLNQLIQGYQKQTLNPDQAELFTRLQAIVNTYSAVMSRGANITTDASRHRADDLLNGAADAKTLHRVMDTMQQEIDMAKNSPERMRKFYNEKYGAKAVEGGTPPPAPTPGAGAADPLGIR